MLISYLKTSFINYCGDHKQQYSELVVPRIKIKTSQI